MDRPKSISASKPAHQGHKRTSSKPITTTTTTTTAKADETALVNLYLTDLRLLNLDLLPDWPHIVTSHFLPQTGHATRTRLTSTEWSLYQLFRLYDHTLTVEKLRPFFPPLEPVQSVNLRAALFRCLESLRKAGVLGREVVLRKSMLDECTGTRLWEVCLAFSHVVLGKVVREGRMRYGRPCVAERLGTGENREKREGELVEPLVLAHKAGLGRVLRERKEKEGLAVGVEEILEAKGEELAGRRERLEERRGETEGSGELKALEEDLQNNWVGNDDFKNAVLHGDGSAAGDEVVRQSFEQLWQSRTGEPEARDSESRLGKLENLKNQSNDQNARLQRWQRYHDRLLASKPSESPSKAASETANPRLRFQHHRSLTLQTDQPSMTLPSPTTQTSPTAKTSPTAHSPQTTSATQYDDILTRMREDLRKASTTRQTSTAPLRPSLHQRSQTTQGLSRGLTPNEDAFPGASPETSSPHDLLPQSPGHPMRPGMGGRQSSRSKSWKQPRVISAKGPIPLKSEIFSPLKAGRKSVVVESPGSASSAASGSLTGSPEEQLRGTPMEMNERGKTDWHDSSTAPDSAVGLGVDRRKTISPSASPDSARNDAEERQEFSPNSTDEMARPTPYDAIFKIPALPPPKTAPAASSTRLSLAERARLSMTPFNNSDNTNTNGFLPDTPSSAPVTFEKAAAISYTPVDEQADPLLTRRVSLADRTRASISQMPQNTRPSYGRKASNRDTKPSKVHPVNQFDAIERESTPPTADPDNSAISPPQALTDTQHQDDKQAPTKTTRETTPTPDPTLSPLPPTDQNPPSTATSPDSDSDSASPTHLPPPAVTSNKHAQTAGKKKRDITPLQTLFDPSAEYASVFRSRPRVATSPPLPSLSPDRDEE
ncbi:hypothetical protein MBLNU230_g3283t1 [Neophaeotheca triangularis]